GFDHAEKHVTHHPPHRRRLDEQPERGEVVREGSADVVVADFGDERRRPGDIDEERALARSAGYLDRGRDVLLGVLQRLLDSECAYDHAPRRMQEDLRRACIWHRYRPAGWLANITSLA